MELTGWRGSLYYYMDWALKLAYLNILWLVGIVIGIGFAGFFPSTVAMFSVLRKWTQGEDEELKVLSHFKSEYKKEFIKSNKYGYLWAGFGLVIYVDLQFFRGIPSMWALIVSLFFFMLGAIYIVALLYSFPVYVHYKLTIKQYFKNCVLIVLSNPLFSVFMVLGFYFPYYLMMKIPGLLLFFSGSLIGLVLMIISNKMFTILEKNKEQNNPK
ncbi:YesL family protein [Psychrobacillus sp.]|uniref:YesL family protein n=1 Tax=Psychrobacillus sp. TaxID=1871623 RepID=UPI0028BF3157|nr:YesL family protein [Psychrobacillus sp.]